MQKFFGASLFVIATLFSATKDGLGCCKKQINIMEQEVLTKEELTAHTWIDKEIRAVYGGDIVYYLRGGTENTLNYDREYFTFNSDGSGWSIDANGYSHKIKEWKFADVTHIKLVFKYYVTNSTIYHDFTWDHIEYKNKTIISEDYLHDNYVDKNYHGRAERFAK
jgi:hypothetical protein